MAVVSFVHLYLVLLGCSGRQPLSSAGARSSAVARLRQTLGVTIPGPIEAHLAALLATEWSDGPAPPTAGASEERYAVWLREMDLWLAEVDTPRRRELVHDLLQLDQQLADRPDAGVTLARGLVHEELIALGCRNGTCMSADWSDVHRAEASRLYHACRSATTASALRAACERRARVLLLRGRGAPECAAGRGVAPAGFLSDQDSAPRPGRPLRLRLDMNPELLVRESERQALEAQIAARVAASTHRAIAHPLHDGDWPPQCEWVQRSSPQGDVLHAFVQGTTVTEAELHIDLDWLDEEDAERHDTDDLPTRFSIVAPETWGPAIDQQLSAPPLYGGDLPLGAWLPGPVAWETITDGAPVAPDTIDQELAALREACGVTPHVPIRLLLGFDVHGALAWGEVRRDDVYPPATVRCVNSALALRAAQRTSSVREVSRVGVTSNLPFHAQFIEEPLWLRPVYGSVLLSPDVSSAMALCATTSPRFEVCAHVRPDGSVDEIEVSQQTDSSPRVLVRGRLPREASGAFLACMENALRTYRMPCSREGGLFVLGAAVGR